MRLPRMRHPRLFGMANAKVTARVPKFAGGGKVEKVLHEFKVGKLHSGSKRGPLVRSRQQAIAIALNQARKALGHKSGGAVLPPSKKTVDMVEKGRVVVRHEFYGKDAREAAHMLASHKKADRSFADALAGRKYKGIDIRAVKRARGGLVGYDDGGSIPSYEQYIASGAAPGGLSPEEYQADYPRYLSELLQAQSPVTGRALNFRDPAKVDEIRRERTRSLPIALASGVWNGIPWLRGDLAMALFGLDLGKSAGLVPESVPRWSELPRYVGMPTDDPAWTGAADAVDMGGLFTQGPRVMRELAGTAKRGAKDIARIVRGFRRQPASE